MNVVVILFFVFSTFAVPLLTAKEGPASFVEAGKRVRTLSPIAEIFDGANNKEASKDFSSASVSFEVTPDEVYN